MKITPDVRGISSSCVALGNALVDHIQWWMSFLIGYAIGKAIDILWRLVHPYIDITVYPTTIKSGEPVTILGETNIRRGRTLHVFLDGRRIQSFMKPGKVFAVTVALPFVHRSGLAQFQLDVSDNTKNR